MPGPDPSPSSVGDGRNTAGACNVRELVEYAKGTLLQREQDALHDLQSLESRKERVQSLLLTSMEMAEEDNTPENVAELERAIEVAQKAQVLPGLRVKARKLLQRVSQTDKWLSHIEGLLQRTTAQLEELHNAVHDSVLDDKEGGQPKSATREVREDLLIRQLRQTLDQAAGVGVNKVFTEKAEAVIRMVEKRRRSNEAAAARLQSLLHINDPETLGEKIESVRKHCDMTSESARRVVSEIQNRVGKLAAQEQDQQWLNAELATAAQNSDVSRLQQLVHQAKTLNLQVPPSSIALLHSLEASQPRQRRDARTGSDRREEVASAAALERARAEAAVAKAEETLGAGELIEARKAVAKAQQSRVPCEVIHPLEKRLAFLEQHNSQRLQAEQELQGLLSRTTRREDHVLHDGRQVERLRTALHRAELHDADPEIISAGIDLLEKSTEARDMRRRAEELLHQALARPARSEADLDLLQEAIDEGRKCGITTLHAEKELARARDVQVHREAAEAELQEAAKGFGIQARARLEAAVQTAKSAGVAVEKLRAATARLSELSRHEERCSLAAGNLRRALPLLQSEPWRFQKVMEAVQSLQPRTAELEKLVKDGQSRLEKALEAQCQQREAQQELQLIVRQIKEGRASGHLCADHMTELTRSIERAGAARVGQELLAEAEKQLRSLRREGCQRMVAEHRLRLALSARDHGELERSLRQVRALGRAGLLEAGAAATGAAAGGGAPRAGGERPERPEAPRSARLLEAAGAALRQLGDAAGRRRAAASALRELAEGTGAPGEDSPREAAEALREARQSGVAPALVEHARLRLRERKRERREEDRARAALQASLSKKDAPTQEVLRNLRRVERLQAAR